MNLEETKIATDKIQKQISDLKELENVLNLAKIYHYTQTLFDGNKFGTEQFVIEPYSKKDKYDVFQISYKSNDIFYSSGFYSLLYRNCSHTQTIEFKDEYKNVMNLIQKENISSIIIRKDTTLDNFFSQISERYKSIYLAYELENDLSVNNIKSKAILKV